MSALGNDATCRVVGKRRLVAALQMKAMPKIWPIRNKKSRPRGRLRCFSQALRRRGSFGRGGSFGLEGGLFTLDIGLAALFVLVFVVLFAHKCLYNFFTGCDFVCAL